MSHHLFSLAFLLALIGATGAPLAAQPEPSDAASFRPDPGDQPPTNDQSPADADCAQPDCRQIDPGEAAGDCQEGDDCVASVGLECDDGDGCDDVRLEEDCDETDEGECTERTGSWIVVPIIALSPETDFVFGLGYLHSFFLGSPSDTSLSASRLAAQYSLNKQLSASWIPRFYFPGDVLGLRLEIGFNDFPNTYWGIGPETPDANEEDYATRSWIGRVDLDRRLNDEIFVGGIYEVESFRIIDNEAGGLLDTVAPGRRGGLVSGLGLSFTRDSRDNKYATRDGQFQRVTLTNFGAWIGGDYDFTRLDLDSRHFIDVGRLNHVLAAQAMVNLNFGDPPFERLALLGGDSMLRGYFEGRFRDNHSVTVQGEYRTPYLWRFGLVAFFGLGWVFGDVGDIDLGETKWAGGTGLRFAFDPEERIHVRADFGVGPDSSGFYISFGEAF